MSLKAILKSAPLVGPLIQKIRAPKLVESSAAYWESRYRSGGNSGAGSYNRLANFKAEFINNYVATKNIGSVLEFGSGDGAQLALAQYPRYTGVDVSHTIIAKAREAFAHNATFQFIHTSELRSDIRAELTLSLDVIFHLTENSVFDTYMRQLFAAADKAVIVYSSNMEEIWAPHVRHRKFTNWIKANEPDFKLVQHLANPYPYDEHDLDNTSFADFYVYEKLARSV